jgi:hypothetical protein
LHSELKWIRQSGDEPIRAAIEATGTITPAPPILEGIDPAIRPTIRSASHEAQQFVTPSTHALTNVNKRSLELTVTLTPPAGTTQLQMEITQQRGLTAIR